MYGISVSFSIPRERLLDILTTAVESGISYWTNDGDFKEVHVARDSENRVTSIRFTKHSSKGLTFAPRAIVAGHRENVAIVDVIELAGAIGNALQLDSKGNNVHNDAARAAVREMWYGEWDATTADVLVQFALFGEVVYG